MPTRLQQLVAAAGNRGRAGKHQSASSRTCSVQPCCNCARLKEKCNSKTNCTAMHIFAGNSIWFPAPSHRPEFLRATIFQAWHFAVIAMNNLIHSLCYFSNVSSCMDIKFTQWIFSLIFTCEQLWIYWHSLIVTQQRTIKHMLVFISRRICLHFAQMKRIREWRCVAYDPKDRQVD